MSVVVQSKGMGRLRAPDTLFHSVPTPQKRAFTCPKLSSPPEQLFWHPLIRFLLSAPPPQVREFVKGAYERTVALLKEKKELVESMAQVGWGRVGSGLWHRWRAWGEGWRACASTQLLVPLAFCLTRSHMYTCADTHTHSY